MKCMLAEVFLEIAYQRNNRLPSQISRSKLRNSKIIARKLRAIYPKYRVHLKHLTCSHKTQNHYRYSITSTCDTIPGIENASKRDEGHASNSICWR